MKMATLDQHRGYVKDTYGEVQQERNTEYLAKSQAAGYQVIREPLWNKGMCISRVPSSPTLARAVNPVDTWFSIYARSSDGRSSHREIVGGQFLECHHTNNAARSPCRSLIYP